MNPLFEKIAREIGKSGVITFARFMELALYCPVYGYYEKKTGNLGRRGDFFTSVSAGALFGELLAFQFSEWLAEFSDNGGRLKIVETGAHDGQFARDVMNWLRVHRKSLCERMVYCIVEPSARRREQQQAMLREFGDGIFWTDTLSALAAMEKAAAVRGIIFSNELLDAMPTHRLGWGAAERAWFEWGVGVSGEKFVHVKMPKASIPPPALPESVLDVLPDGFTTEVCVAAEKWWSEAADILTRGKLLTIDYGLDAGEFFMPERHDGTLRGYQRHHLITDLLANAGEQDLTAHVNFTAIQRSGERSGLTTEAIVSQEKFLIQIVERLSKRPDEFGEWNSERTRQFQTLTHPEHLGRSFRVLVQSRPAGP